MSQIIGDATARVPPRFREFRLRPNPNAAIWLVIIDRDDFRFRLLAFSLFLQRNNGCDSA